MSQPRQDVVLTILPDETQLIVRSGETMFHALRRYGYALRAGCREGGCGVCVLEVVSGDTFDLLPVAATVLSDADRARGLCLPCRAVPTTDVVVRRDSRNALRSSPFSGRLAAKDVARHTGDAQS